APLDVGGPLCERDCRRLPVADGRDPLGTRAGKELTETFQLEPAQADCLLSCTLAEARNGQRAGGRIGVDGQAVKTRRDRRSVELAPLLLSHSAEVGSGSGTDSTIEGASGTATRLAPVRPPRRYRIC